MILYELTGLHSCCSSLNYEIPRVNKGEQLLQAWDKVLITSGYTDDAELLSKPCPIYAPKIPCETSAVASITQARSSMPDIGRRAIVRIVYIQCVSIHSNRRQVLHPDKKVKESQSKIGSVGKTYLRPKLGIRCGWKQCFHSNIGCHIFPTSR